MPQPPRASIDQILADQLVTLQRATSLHYDIMSMTRERKSIAGFTVNDSPSGLGRFPSRGTSKTEDCSVVSREELVMEEQVMRHSNGTHPDPDGQSGCGAFTFCSPPKHSPVHDLSDPTPTSLDRDIVSMTPERKSIAGLARNNSSNGIGGFPNRGTSKNEDYRVMSRSTSPGPTFPTHEPKRQNSVVSQGPLVQEPQVLQQSNGTEQDAQIACAPALRQSSSAVHRQPPSTQMLALASIQEPLLPTTPKNRDGHDGAQHVQHTKRAPAKKSYNHVFTDQRKVKSNVEKLLAKVTDSPENHYSDKGIWQALARSEHFQNAALCVILLNCLWLAVDTEYDHAAFIWYAPNLFWIVDNIFCFVFTAEILVRFNAFKFWSDAFLYGSFIFDAILVGSMIWDTWIVTLLIIWMEHAPNGTGERAATVLRVLRLFRIFRISRVVRLLNKVPDLAVLVKGMLIAMRATMSVLMLLGLVIYIFSIVLMQLLQKTDVAKGQFSSFGSSVHLLLMQVLCGPDSDLATDMLHAGFVIYLVYLFYLFIAQLTIMNMLIGILCDVVSCVSETEKESAFDSELNDFLQEVAKKLDTDGSGTVSKEEFDEMFNDPETAWAMTSMGLDMVSISDYAAFIFREIEELSYSDFYHMLGQFRGAKTATLKDLMDLRKYLVVELSPQESDFDHMMSQENLVFAHDGGMGHAVS